MRIPCRAAVVTLSGAEPALLAFDARYINANPQIPVTVRKNSV